MIESKTNWGGDSLTFSVLSRLARRWEYAESEGIAYEDDSDYNEGNYLTRDHSSTGICCVQQNDNKGRIRSDRRNRVPGNVLVHIHSEGRALRRLEWLGNNILRSEEHGKRFRNGKYERRRSLAKGVAISERGWCCA